MQSKIDRLASVNGQEQTDVADAPAQAGVAAEESADVKADDDDDDDDDDGEHEPEIELGVVKKVQHTLYNTEVT